MVQQLKQQRISIWNYGWKTPFVALQIALKRSLRYVMWLLESAVYLSDVPRI